mgnify:FL=1
MLSPELRKLMKNLENNNIFDKNINSKELLKELRTLDEKPINESLSMSENVCPTCGRAL